MITTTEDRGLIHRQAQPAPRPGHDLIVFDTTARGGRRFRAKLGPEDEFKPSLAEKLLRSDHAPIGYAVSRDRHLHVFARSMPTIEGSALPVSITLEVSVGDAQLVAERLDHDPLKRLEEEAASRLAKAIRPLAIADVSRDALDVERIALGHPMDDEQGCRSTCAEILASFAPRLGLVLHRIGLEWSLPDKWKDHFDTLQSVELDAEVETHKKVQDHRLDLLKDEHAGKRRNAEHAAELGRGYRSAIARKVIEAVENRNTGSLPTLVDELHGLERRLKGFTEQSFAALPETASRATVDGEAEGLLSVLGRLLEMVEDGRYEPAVRRRVLAAGLRALAAAIDGGDGARNGGDASRPQETLKLTLADLLREDRLASNKDRQLLQQLADPEALRELGWKGLDRGA